MAKGMKKRFSVISVLLIIVIGVVFGEIITYLTRDIAALNWLNIGYTFGLQSPLVLDLSVISLTLGFALHINVAVLLGILISSLFYRFVF